MSYLKRIKKENFYTRTLVGEVFHIFDKQYEDWTSYDILVWLLWFLTSIKFYPDLCRTFININEYKFFFKKSEVFII